MAVYESNSNEILELKILNNYVCLGKKNQKMKQYIQIK